MNKFFNLTIAIMIAAAISCNNIGNNADNSGSKDSLKKDDFKYLVEQFADVKVMRYTIPGFEKLSLKQKELIYYLCQAAYCGRDITFDQNYKFNLLIKRTLEAIVRSFNGDRESDDFKKFMTYTKRFWFMNGIHHHYSTDKIFPEFSKEYFAELVKNSPDKKPPLENGEKIDDLLKKVTPIIFDPAIAPKRVSLDSGKDLVANSANNFYEGVTQKEVESFYNSLMKPDDKTPVSYGLNSKLTREIVTRGTTPGKIIEKVWKIDGMYGKAIEQIVSWLEKAANVAENDKQKASLQKLIEYYKTGDLKTWDDYNILWVLDLDASVDVVNGFIEVYGDPMSKKATWESVVNFKDVEATKRSEIISANAQWFEDHSPVDDRFRKKEVKGVTAKVITVAALGGDCFPTTPIGINLPNADWIRRDHGSKSVTMENITYAYDQAALGNGMLEEFCLNSEEIELTKKYGFLAGNLHTDLHECLGHGSGQLLPGVSADAMKNYHSALEEARADLFALYYIMDPKMVELGILPTLEAAKAEYSSYIRNGLMIQLVRIELGKTIEQAHMRCRQLIAGWCYEKGMAEKVISKETKDGKTYFVINDYEKLKKLFGELLKEMQRIKSEGDFEAGKNMVEKYAVAIDPVLHKEVKERYAKLNLAPYGGFMNPELEPVMQDGKIIDVRVSYPDNYTKQMMDYAEKYSFLPVIN